MSDLSGGSAVVDVKPSMKGYFRRVRSEIHANPVEHKIEPTVDRAALDKATGKLEDAARKAETARRKQADATDAVGVAEARLKTLQDKGIADAGRLAAARAAVAKATRAQHAATAELHAAESKRAMATNRVARIEARIDSTRAEADSASFLQRLTGRFRSGGQTAGSQFVSGVSAGMNSRARGNDEGRSFAAGFVSAIGTGMRGAVTGFALLSTAAHAVVKNVGTAATVLGLAARAVRHFSVGLLASTTLLKMMTGAGVAKLAGVLRLAAAAAGILARDIGRVTSALLLMAAAAKLVGILTRVGRALGMVTVGSAVALGAVAALGSVVSSFATGPLVAGLTAVAAAMGTVAAAAAGILGPAIGVAKMAFAGLSDGAKAWDQAQKNAGATASKSASALKAVDNAKKAQVRTAEQGNRQIVQAEKQVVKAQEAVEEAQKDVNKARQEAKRDAEGYARTLAGLALDEEGAALALAEAEKNFRETQAKRARGEADGLDMWRAELGVREAKQAYDEIKATAKQERAEIADAQAKGIEGSDRVVDAKAREADANEQLREAQSDLLQTQKDVAQANIDAADAVTDAYASMAEAQQSAAGDDPFAAMIGQRLAPLLQAFKGLREEITDRFSGAMTDSFTTLGGLVDRLKPGLRGLAGMLGTIGAQITTSISSPAAVAGWDRMIAGSDTFFKSLAQGENGLGSVFSGLISVLGTAAETFAHTGAGINEWLLGIGEKLQNISADDLRGSLESVRQTFANIGAVMGPLFELFRGFGAEAASGLAPGFVAVGDAIRDSIPGLMDMAQVLMPALGQALENLAPVLPGLVEAFHPWADTLAVLAPHLATIIEKLVPFAPLLLGIVMAVKVIGTAITVWNGIMFAASVAQGVFAAATGRSAATLGTNTIALAAHRAALIAGTVAQWALNAAMSANPIALIVIAIAALVGALVWFFTQTETGKRIWETVWNGIKTAMSVAWEFIKSVFDKLGAVFTWLYENIVQPVFNALKIALAVVVTAFLMWWEGVKLYLGFVGDVISALWNAIARPIWEAMKAGLRALGAFFGYVWNSLIRPAWDALGNGVKAVWEHVISPAWDALKAALGAIGDFFSSVWTSVIKPAWDGLGNGIKAVWEKVIGPAWDAMKGALGKVGEYFDTIVKGIKSVWEDLRGILAKPINYMINTVWNEGILKAWNKAAGLLGLGEAQPLSGIREYASGGSVRGPGTGTSDDIPAMLSNGEHVWTAKEVLAAGGHAQVEKMRQAALHGGPALYARGGPVELDAPPWSGGGGESNLKPAAILARRNIHMYWPEITTIGGYRAQDPYPDHPSGLALDIMTGDPIGTQINNWLHEQMDALALNYTIWQQRYRPAGGAGNLMEDRGSITQNHYDHVHALFNPNGVAGIQDGGVGGGGVSSGDKESFLQRKIAEIFDVALKPIKDAIGVKIGTPPPEWLGIPPAFLDKGRDMTSGFLADKVTALGDQLTDAWNKAKDIGNAMTFGLFRDKGGWIPNGLSIVRNETGRPEAVLNWDQLELIKDLLLGGDVAGALRAVGMLNNAPAAEATPAADYSQYGYEQDKVEVGPAAAAKYASEIDWLGIGGQIGTSLLAEWGNDLLGMAGFSNQFKGLQLVDDTGRRSDEAQVRSEATYDDYKTDTPAPVTTETPAESSGSTATAAGPESVVDAVKRAFAPYGWSDGEQWAAADWIIRKESGWNPLARNPSSGAFSLFQFLGSTKDAYLPDESPDPYTQGVAGAKYIRDRYGDPIRAKSFWEKNGFYDQGGIARGKGFLLKNVIQPERVLSPRETEAFEALIPMLGRIQSPTSAPPEAMSTADRLALELAPAGAGGDVWNVNGRLDPETRREIQIMINQRDRGHGRSSESRNRW